MFVFLELMGRVSKLYEPVDVIFFSICVVQKCLCLSMYLHKRMQKISDLGIAAIEFKCYYKS